MSDNNKRYSMNRDVEGYIQELFNNPEKLLSEVVPRFISPNEKIKDNAETVNVLDFTVCFCVQHLTKKDKTMVIYIPKGYIDPTILYSAAVNNIKGIAIDINKLMGLVDYNMPMLALTTESHSFGAAVILNSDLLKSISDELDDDLVIVPSSVHEVIVQRWKDINDDLTYVRDILTNMNTTTTSKHDRLSNNIYHFSRGNQKLTII